MAKYRLLTCNQLPRPGLVRTFATGVALAWCVTAGNVSAVGLIELYELARNNDPWYLQAQAVRAEKLELTDQARASLLPKLEGQASHTRTLTSLDAPGGPWRNFSTNSLSLTVTQPVYRRDLFVALDQAESEVAKAEVDYAFSLQALMLRVATTYFSVLNSVDNSTFASANKQAISEQLKQAQQRFDVGLIAVTGVEEAKARFDLATSIAIRAENQLNDTIEALREIVGEYYEASALAKLGDEMPLVTPKPDNIDQWTKIAFEQNLQVASANFDVVIAKKEIKRRHSGHYPSLTLVGTASGSDASKTRVTEGLETQDASLSLQLKIPLYEGGRVSSDTRQARAQYQQALNAYEVARRTVQRETRQSFTGVKSGIAQVKALRQAVVSNKSALDAVQAGFQVGTRTSVDVLDAQREFFLAEFDYAEARYDYIVNILTLKRAAGTLSEADLRGVNKWLTE